MNTTVTSNTEFDTSQHKQNDEQFFKQKRERLQSYLTRKRLDYSSSSVRTQFDWLSK